MAVAYSMYAAAGRLKTLLDHLESQLGWVILENVADIQFLSVGQKSDGFRFDHAFDPSFWERGRAFGEHLEVRWRYKRDRHAILLLAEAPVTLPPEVAAEIRPFPEPVLLESPENSPLIRIALWGEWQDPKTEPDLPSSADLYWYETRIPRFLPYPWDKPAKHLAIEVTRYRVHPQKPDTPPDWPADFIYRFVRLREMPMGPETVQDGATEVSGERGE